MSAIRILLAAFLGGIFSLVSAQTPTDPPNLDLWTHGAVFKTEQESSGNLLVGGLFALAGGLPRHNIARILLPAETIDPDFAPVVNGPVFVILQQADGRILIGGQFSRVNGTVRNNIARLNANGTLDNSWNPGANAPVYVLETDGPDHVIAAGSFSQFGGQTRRGLARVALAGGTVDETWNPDVSGGGVFALARMATDIWIGGNFNQVGGQASRSLARLSPAGALVTAHDVNGNVEAISFDSGTGGGLYFCGRFSLVDGQPRSRLARLDLDGTLDSFAISVDHDIHDCKASDGSVLLGGQFLSINGEAVAGAARLSSSGLVNPDFRPSVGGVYTGKPGSDVLVWTIRELGEGRVFIGGVFRRIDNESRVGAALLDDQDGQLLSSIHVERPAEVRAVLQLDDGALILGGAFWRSAQQVRDNLLRVRPDGELDSDWVLPINGEVLSAGLVSDGSLVVGGFFSAADGHPRANLARLVLDAEPSVHPVWAPDADGAVLVVQQDQLDPDRVYVAGNFVSILADQVYPRSAMARLALNDDGIPDDFDPGFNGQVNDLLQMPMAGRFYVAGVFSQALGQSRRGIAAFVDAEGATQLDASFDAGANGNLWVLEAAADGESFYAGGEFTTLFEAPRLRLAKVGAGFDDWTPGTLGTPVAMALDGVGGLYVGGTFLTLNGVERGLIGRLDAADGSLDLDFNPGAQPGLVWQVEVGLSRLFIAGSFQQAGGSVRNGFAAFEIETPIPPRPDPIFFDRFEQTSPSEPEAGRSELTESGELWLVECLDETVLTGRDRTSAFLRGPACR